jgi:hypothetical protein
LAAGRGEIPQTSQPVMSTVTSQPIMSTVIVSGLQSTFHQQPAIFHVRKRGVTDVLLVNRQQKSLDNTIHHM